MGALYSRIATVTGQTFDEIDQQPLFHILDLVDYWTDHPPVHEMVAAFFEIKPRKRSKRKVTRKELEELVRKWKGPGGK